MLIPSAAAPAVSEARRPPAARIFLFRSRGFCSFSSSPRGFRRRGVRATPRERERAEEVGGAPRGVGSRARRSVARSQKGSSSSSPREGSDSAGSATRARARVSSPSSRGRNTAVSSSRKRGGVVVSPPETSADDRAGAFVAGGRRALDARAGGRRPGAAVRGRGGRGGGGARRAPSARRRPTPRTPPSGVRTPRRRRGFSSARPHPGPPRRPRRAWRAIGANRGRREGGVRRSRRVRRGEGGAARGASGGSEPGPGGFLKGGGFLGTRDANPGSAATRTTTPYACWNNAALPPPACTPPRASSFVGLARDVGARAGRRAAPRSRALLPDRRAPPRAVVRVQAQGGGPAPPPGSRDADPRVPQVPQRHRGPVPRPPPVALLVQLPRPRRVEAARRADAPPREGRLHPRQAPERARIHPPRVPRGGARHVPRDQPA